MGHGLLEDSESRLGFNRSGPEVGRLCRFLNLASISTDDGLVSRES